MHSSALEVSCCNNSRHAPGTAPSQLRDLPGDGTVPPEIHLFLFLLVNLKETTTLYLKTQTRIILFFEKFVWAVLELTVHQAGIQLTKLPVSASHELGFEACAVTAWPNFANRAETSPVFPNCRILNHWVQN